MRSYMLAGHLRCKMCLAGVRAQRGDGTRVRVAKHMYRLHNRTFHGVISHFLHALRRLSELMYPAYRKWQSVFKQLIETLLEYSALPCQLDQSRSVATYLSITEVPYTP